MWTANKRSAEPVLAHWPERMKKRKSGNMDKPALAAKRQQTEKLPD
jgi:hypothetical protein